jgi:phospholipid transport system substrate-binding protein
VFKFLAVSMLVCAATSSFAGEVQPPDGALKSTVTRLLANLSQHSSQYRDDGGSFYEMIDLEVVPRFDVPGIARFALGRNGRGASPEQQQRFAEALAKMLVHTYARFMLDCGSVDVVWSPVRMPAGADHAHINTMLKVGGVERYPVGFSVRLVDGDWKIYDLDIDGISMALNYRAQVNSEIRATSLDAVIARMAQQSFRKRSASPL